MKKAFLTGSIVTALAVSTVLPGAASAGAAAKYTLKKGKLVQVKTGKTVKGYVVFKKKLYKNGKLNKGYAVVGKGATMKLYYNATLKKGYKQAKNNEYLFKDGALVKGYKQAKDHTFLYNNGVLVKGYKVYKAKTGTVYLYQNGQLKKGLKTATYKQETVLFKNGKIAKGHVVFNKKLYTNGKLNKALTQVGNVFYHKGFLATGMIDGDRYENGVIVETAEEIAFNEAKQVFIENEKEVKQAQAEYDELLALEALLVGEAPAQKAAKLSLKSLSNSEVAAFIAQLKGKDLTTLSVEEKAALLDQIKSHKEVSTVRLQTAVTKYVAAVETVSKASAELAKTTSDLKKVEAVQQLVAEVKESVAVVKETTKEYAEIVMETAALDELIKVVETAIEESPAVVEAPVEEKPAEELEETEETSEEEAPKEEVIEEAPKEEVIEEAPPIEEAPKPSTPNTTPSKPATQLVKEQITKQLARVTFSNTNEDSVTIDGKTYNILENVSEGKAPELYISTEEMKWAQQEIARIKDVMNQSNVTVEQLNTALNDMEYVIEDMLSLASNDELEALKENDHFNDMFIITPNTDEQSLKAAVTQKMTEMLEDGLTFHIIAIEKYEEEDNRYAVTYTLTEGNYTIQSTSNFSQFTSDEALTDAQNEYLSQLDSVVFHKKGDHIQVGETVTIDGKTYEVYDSEEPPTFEDGKQYVTIGDMRDLENYAAEATATTPLWRLAEIVENFVSWKNRIVEQYVMSAEIKTLQSMLYKLNTYFAVTALDEGTVKSEVEQLLKAQTPKGYELTVDCYYVNVEDAYATVEMTIKETGTSNSYKTNIDVSYETVEVFAKRKADAQAMIDQVAITKAGTTFATGDEIIIDSDKYIVSERPENGDANKKYISISDAQYVEEKMQQAHQYFDEENYESLPYFIENLKSTANFSWTNKVRDQLKQATWALPNELVTDVQDLNTLKTLLFDAYNESMNYKYSVVIDDVRVSENDPTYANVQITVSIPSNEMYTYTRNINVKLVSTTAQQQRIDEAKAALTAQIALFTFPSEMTVGNQLTVGTTAYTISQHADEENSTNVFIEPYHAKVAYDAYEKATKALASANVQDMKEATEALQQSAKELDFLSSNKAIFEVRNAMQLMLNRTIVYTNVTEGETLLPEVEQALNNNDEGMTFKLSEANVYTTNDTFGNNLYVYGTVEKNGVTAKVSRNVHTVTIADKATFKTNVIKAFNDVVNNVTTTDTTLTVDGVTYAVSNAPEQEEGSNMFVSPYFVEDFSKNINDVKALLANDPVSIESLLSYEGLLDYDVQVQATNKTYEYLKDMASHLQAIPAVSATLDVFSAEDILKDWQAAVTPLLGDELELLHVEKEYDTQKGMVVSYELKKGDVLYQCTRELAVLSPEQNMARVTEFYDAVKQQTATIEQYATFVGLRVYNTNKDMTTLNQAVYEAIEANNGELTFKQLLAIYEASQQH